MYALSSQIVSLLSFIVDSASSFAGLHIVKDDAEAYNTHVHHYLCDLHEKHGRTFVLTREGQPVICVRGSGTVHKVLMSEDFGELT